MNKKKNYSEEVSEIMNKIPNSIVRWGITVLFIISVMIFAGSYLVRYPEIITTNVIVKKTTDINYTKYPNTKIYPDSSVYIAICPIQEKYMGKIKSEQTVNVKLNAYSYYEYGFLKGKIDSIYFDPLNNTYMLIIIFPAGLTTSYKKNIKFHESMSGVANIITQEKRLIDILLKPITTAIKN